MTSATRVLFGLALLGFYIVASPPASVAAQEAQFSLAVGQAVTVGQYTLLFRGVTGKLPSYDLYIGSVLVTRFPSPPPPTYTYANVSIVTTGVAPDGTAATGTMTLK